MLSLRERRRLPGFRFETLAPSLGEKLPRMDIAVFVGFAASGPLHMPVAIEDAEEFAAIFGADAPLAWDRQRCRQVYVQLGPAVRSFFHNGGRRCWVIRVASNEAACNYFPVPGLAMAELKDDGDVARLAPAVARSRSEGSWSDVLTAGSALQSQPFAVITIWRSSGKPPGFLKDSLVVELQAFAGELIVGDLVRLSFDDGTIAMLVVESIAAAFDSPPSDRAYLRVNGLRELWLKPLPRQDERSQATAGKARIFDQAPVDPDQDSSKFPGAELEARINWPTDARKELEVFVPISITNTPHPGSLVSVSDGHNTALMTVSDSGVGEVEGFGRAIRLRGEGSIVTSTPKTLPTGLPRAEKLSFEMWVRRGTNEPTRMTDLAFNAAHPRYWGDLPVDQQFYSKSSFHPSGVPPDPGQIPLGFEKQRMDLGREARSAKFPFAGPEAKGEIYFPLGMSALPVDYLPRLETSAPALKRDGLATFDASLFLDPELIDNNALTFETQADFLRYQSPTPRALRGIHAAFEIEEATIIAVPDAVHVGWKEAKAVELPVAKPSKPIPRPEWWHFRDCTLPENQDKFPLETKPNWGYFLGCDSDPLPSPSLHDVDPAQTAGGNYVLRWFLGSPPSLPPPEAKFILEESLHPEFKDSIVLYTGDQESYSISGRPAGDYFYRIRMIQCHKRSEWSNGIVVRISDNRSYELIKQKDYSLNTLLAVHRALLRMGAARGDLFGVLSVPEHYREDDVISYVEELKSWTGSAISVDSKFTFEFEGNIQTRAVHAVSLPLSTGETGVFSHASLYHPWLIGTEPRDRFAVVSPDGAACGILAARALSRGAWIAPANEALRGPVALKPPIRADRWLDLQESNINIIRQDVRGFMALSADTLSSDDELRPINIRRLLSLLRRLALRLGAGYVFEPNDASFRRAVQRGFEAMLGEMFVAGAFAGATPQTSFQVVTSDSLNTPQSVDLGRFIVELRVAPSLPMTFMTIRLVQTGDRSFVTETR